VQNKINKSKMEYKAGKRELTAHWFAAEVSNPGAHWHPVPSDRGSLPKGHSRGSLLGTELKDICVEVAMAVKSP
jgi:hypothetical protein